MLDLLIALEAVWQDHHKAQDRRTVVNLSLGLELDERTKNALGLSEAQLKEWCETAYSDPDAQKSCLKDSTEDVAAIRALEKHLIAMTGKGIMVVAAAGNGSDHSHTDEMQKPAAYPFVIGVSASNPSGKRSCYSNEKKADGPWIMAPGGDGDTKCNPPAKACLDGGGTDCGHTVISLLKLAPDVQYGYWVGTSFATPLVSGLAARCLAQITTGTQSPTKQDIADSTWAALKTGAVDSSNVINVPKTLASCK